MQKVVLNLPTAERPMLSQVFPGPDIGAILENPSLASTEKQVDFDACHWLGREPWYCQSWIGCVKRFLFGTVWLFDQNLVSHISLSQKVISVLLSSLAAEIFHTKPPLVPAAKI